MRNPLVITQLHLLIHLLLFFFFHWVRVSRYWKKKNCAKWQVLGPQIVWKILSDDNWVMVPNGCSILKWWVMSDEWRKLSGEKYASKHGLKVLGNFHMEPCLFHTTTKYNWICGFKWRFQVWKLKDVCLNTAYFAKTEKLLMKVL